MDKLFPRMYDCPESKQIAMGGLYWVVYMVMLPFLMLIVFAASDSATDPEILVMGNLCYFLVNAVVVFFVFREYLVDSFWNVRLNKSRFYISVGSGLLVFFIAEMVIVCLEAAITGTVNPYPLPAADALFFDRGLVLLFAGPLLMGLCLVTIVPITMCCLYYAVGFAAPCQDKIWPGYLVVALLSAIPAVLQVTAIGNTPTEALRFYFEMLPFHMCACWVYQRSDTIWGAIVFHSAANLLSIPSVAFLTYLESITEYAAKH